jgi:phospholipase C
VLAILAACGGPAPASTGSAQAGTSAKSPLDHVIVIYLENRSFDHVYGLFPGA